MDGLLDLRVRRKGGSGGVVADAAIALFCEGRHNGSVEVVA